MEGDGSLSDSVATRACASCRKNKRRCDKSLPSCRLCLRTGRQCDYSDASPSSQTDEISDLQRRIRELEERVLPSSSQTPCNEPNGMCSPELSIQAFYLDSDLWSSCDIPGHAVHSISIPERVSTVLGSQLDIDSVKFRYFQSVHTWMPIISKIRLNRATQRAQETMKADVALVLLCMKLVQEVPQEQQTGLSELYATAKQFSKELELQGLFTIRTIQAGLLLAVYEVGHGIFPAAFTTIGYCARQGVVLGLHSKLAPSLIGKLRSWVDWEERQRVWWMVLVMDRHVTVGADHRPLCTEDPSKDTLLPADESAWDNGEMVPPERVCLSSQSNRNAVSPFVRLAQASNLLGRVIRHCNDVTLELQFALDDFEMLCQAIHSLIKLFSVDDSGESMEMNIAATICFSALLKLFNHHSCDMYNEQSQYLGLDSAPRVRQCMQKSIHMIKETCGRIVSFVQDLEQKLTQSAMERVSPLMLHCIYICAASLSWMSLDTDNIQYTPGKTICEDMLRSLSVRWKVAGVYLELLRIGDLAQDENS